MSHRLHTLIAVAILLGGFQAQAQDTIARPPVTDHRVEVMLLSINTEAIHVIIDGKEVETIAFRSYKESKTADSNVRQFPLLSSVLQRLYDEGWRVDDSAAAGGMPLLYVLTRESK